MGRFNLLDEPWISVLVERTGEKKDVSMVEFFRNASDYYSLAGEMETQNFAVMRFLLSVIHTVFSRFDYDGNVLPGVSLDERWIQTEDVDEDEDEDDWKEYDEAVSECWKQLFLSGAFPNIVIDYLEKWRNHFYLFDEENPFFQVNKKEMDEIMEGVPNKSEPTTIYGKNINRTISESENKIALFSPISNSGTGKRGIKDVQTSAEFARWLIMFQGYSGLADKVSLTTDNQRPSKGWLFDLGGIFLRGNNIFETLVMNYIPGGPSGNPELSGRIQKPCWEQSGRFVVERLCRCRDIDNLAELYTNWSRAVYIDPETDMSEPVKINVIKLPEIEHTEKSIEPMAMWRRNDTGSNKNCFTPKKHSIEESLWRHFGIIVPVSNDSKKHIPAIFEQYGRLKAVTGSRWTDLVGVGMADDGNATSWLPVDEITDSFRINDIVITDTNSDGWVIRINDAVETTKEVVSHIFKRYLMGICEVRNITDPNKKGFINRETEKTYSIVDKLFKEWLETIKPDDPKETKITEWYSQLRAIILSRGEELFETGTARDLSGIEKETGIENIATNYWIFVNMINKKIGGGKK